MSPYFGSHLTDHLPIWHYVFPVPLTEWSVLVPILSVQADVEGRGFDTRCPDGDFYPSGLVTVGRIFRIAPRVIYGTRAMGSATIILCCLHRLAVPDGILIAIEDHPWRKEQESKLFHAANLIFQH